MDTYPVNIEGVFKALDDRKYMYRIIEPINGNNMVIRASFCSVQEAKKLFSDISRNTVTRWVRYRKYSPLRDTYHAVWKCHLSSYRKSASSPKNTGCNASFSIRIKCITKWTKKRDEYLRLDPPLCGKITFALEHNHFLYSTANLAKVSDEVKNAFFSYFGMGMTVIEAKHAHENHLLSLGEEIKNTKNQNPTWRQVYHLDTLYRSGKYKGQQSAFQALKNKEKDALSSIRQDPSLEYAVSTNLSSSEESHEELKPAIQLERRFSCLSDITGDKFLYKEDDREAHEEKSSDDNITSSEEQTNKYRGDKLKYFIFGPKKSSKNSTELTCSVTHEEALTAAQTLFSYMLSQNDAERTDLSLIQSYIEKIEEKILVDE